jgi:hypothetical protein
VRAVFAPALVGWVGSRGNYVSWVPLGPRDVYRPGHRYSRHYWERVNFSNSRIVDRTRVREVFDRRGGPEDFHNRSIPDGVTAVPRASFAGAQRVGDRRVRFNEREMAGHADARDNRPGPGVAPVRESRLGGVVRANPRIPAAVAARQVVVKREPPAASTRYTRRAPERNENWQTQPDRGTRTPRPADVSPRGRDIAGDVQADPRADRARSRDNYRERERPIDRQAPQSPDPSPSPDNRPPVRSLPAEQRSQPDRPREDRPDAQQRERWQQRNDVERGEREARGDNRESPYSQYSQRPQRTQDAVREAMSRQFEQRQQAPREREIERSRPEPREQPRMEPPRERPRMEQPREQSRPEPRSEPRQERSQPPPQPSRQERQSPARERPRMEHPREQSRPEPRSEPRQERSQPPPQPSRQERQSPAEQRSQRQGDGNRPNKR